MIAEPEERLSVQRQILLLNEAATALKDDYLGFTLARNFDLREIGLVYYVMASSQTLGDALKRLVHYGPLLSLYDQHGDDAYEIFEARWP